MFLSGVQSVFSLDSRLKHAGMTVFGKEISCPSKLQEIDRQRLNLGAQKMEVNDV
jgi:hypothetical protein